MEEFSIHNVRDFTICFNTKGLGLRLNVIKDLCLLILHQLIVGWIGKAHSLTSGIRARLYVRVVGATLWRRDFTICSNTNGLGLWSNTIKDLCPLILHQLVVGWISKAHSPIHNNNSNNKMKCDKSKEKI